MPKSTKAIKVTDQNKAWNKKAKPSAQRFSCFIVTRILVYAIFFYMP